MLEHLAILLDPVLDAGRYIVPVQYAAGYAIVLGLFRYVRNGSRIKVLEGRVARLEQERTPLMFPLTQRTVGGYRFGQRTWYSLGLHRHIGTDYRANGDTVYAPFDGTVTRTGYGRDGGNTLVFVPDHDNVAMRFLHLSKFLVEPGRVSRGQAIAVTGNTGRLTTGPHLHLDISRGYVDLTKSFPSNFIDPETYQWETQQVPTGVDQPIVTGPVEQGTLASVTVPIEFVVQQTRTAYWRQAPTTSSPIMATYAAGATITCSDVVVGQDPYGNGINTWNKSKRSGWYQWTGASKRI